MPNTSPYCTYLSMLVIRKNSTCVLCYISYSVKDINKRKLQTENIKGRTARTRYNAGTARHQANARGCSFTQRTRKCCRTYGFGDLGENRLRHKWVRQLRVSSGMQSPFDNSTLSPKHFQCGICAAVDFGVDRTVPGGIQTSSLTSRDQQRLVISKRWTARE